MSLYTHTHTCMHTYMHTQTNTHTHIQCNCEMQDSTPVQLLPAIKLEGDRFTYVAKR